VVAKGQVAEGLQHLDEAVACDPGSAIAWDNLARIRILVGDFQGGEYAAMRALKLRPADPHLHTRLGIALAAQRRLGEAVHCYRQALALDRGDGEAWAQLGITLFLRNDLGSAGEALAAAVELNGKDANALRHLALVTLSLGRRDAAVAHFERLLDLQPGDDASRLDLAVVLLATQRAAAALEHLERIEGEIRASGKFRFYQALAMRQAGRWEEAQLLLKTIAESDGDAYRDKARALSNDESMRHALELLECTRQQG
jgi:Flp pilus assembly protein TadD